MSLNTNDLALLLALEENPFITITNLADKLKLSRPTVKKRLENLKDAGMLDKPVALYKPEKIGLERKHIFATVPNRESLEVMEQACDKHPYTKYRARTFGGKFGIYMQFEIPPNTSNLLNEFFKALKEGDILDDFRILSSTGLRAVTYPDLKKFDANNLTWNFSWEKWFKSLNNYTYTIKNQIKPETDFSSYKPIHFSILRDLTSDASIKQKDIKDNFKLSKTEAHRHYKYVMDNYVDKVRLMYDRKSFNLTETYIALARIVNNTTRGQIYNQLKENPPPFYVSIDLLEGSNFVMWGNMSPAQANEFAFSIWKTLENVEIHILSTKHGGSSIYWFYPNNFDFDKEEWKKSREYMVTKPLKELKITISD